MKLNLRLAIALCATITLLMAQQPVQLQTVNGGGAVALGHGTAATALRVELPTDGTGVVGAAQSGTWTVQPGNTANSTPWLVTMGPSAASSSALSRFHALSSTSTFTNVNASPGNLYGFSIYNPNTSVCYLQFYNSATPTPGTAVLDSYGVQAGTTLTVAPGPNALTNYSTALSIATDTADAGATQCTTASSVTVYYK